jgi:flagellum-specific peptidoglycan hydrolase FlgJ
MHHQHEPRVISPIAFHLRYFASLRVLATAYFMMHAIGCVHQSTEQTSSSHKSPTVEKPASPVSTQPPRIEQLGKTKSAEKKPSTLKEKKSTASAEKSPNEKPEQPEEPDTDTLVPPPPLRPPIFGGAGG